MALGEFDLIQRYFNRAPRRAALGVGDDCALFSVSPGHQLAVSTDMLVEGRHFLSTVKPERLGHKALAVNLSDLAACGARPLTYQLALSLPRVDEAFLAGLADGLHTLAQAHDIELIGGDTTAGPLNLCITVMGEVPSGQALLRGGARVGDALWVSHAPGGGIGDARLALEVFRGAVDLPGDAFARVRLAMECPQPRVALGIALRGVASAAIDLSDGLLGDLGHVLERSGGLGAVLTFADLPRSDVLAAQPLALQAECALAGGDDYELLFAAPADAESRVLAAAAAAHTAVRRIGRLTPTPGVTVLDCAGRPMPTPWAGFDHFKADRG
jgi:thiamine-monophosphate kinase